MDMSSTKRKMEILRKFKLITAEQVQSDSGRAECLSFTCHMIPVLV